MITETLPEPDQEARAHSGRLVERIAEAIREAGGRLPFDRYMELALYAPGLGYYTAGARKFGAAGDFVTAPEISPLFARCLARQCAEVLGELGGGDILEFGAGSGVLAADLLDELQRLGSLPERYLILELSPELRNRQQQRLAQMPSGLAERVCWLDALPDAGFRGVVLANEVLDAMPVHRFRLHRGGVQEQFVVATPEGLACAWDEPVTPGLEASATGLLPAEAEEGYETEVNLRAGPWLGALGERFAAGLALLIDYGYPRAEYYHPRRRRGTLMCHYRHRAHEDPLFLPGVQDITCQVDFTAVAEAALSAGFNVAGYTTQALFLMGCGLDELVADSDPLDAVAHLRLVQGVKRLTLPAEMGERFKVLGLARGYTGPLRGFALRDMRERL